jgi:hypothetical protein
VRRLRQLPAHTPNAAIWAARPAFKLDVGQVARIDMNPRFYSPWLPRSAHHDKIKISILYPSPMR